jgi:hypothetical protein
VTHEVEFVSRMRTRNNRFGRFWSWEAFLELRDIFKGFQMNFYIIKFASNFFDQFHSSENSISIALKYFLSNFLNLITDRARSFKIFCYSQCRRRQSIIFRKKNKSWFFWSHTKTSMSFQNFTRDFYVFSFWLHSLKYLL